MEENNLTSTALVIFGVTGDLTFRKLIPAVYQIMKSGQMIPELVYLWFCQKRLEPNEATFSNPTIN